MASSFKPYNTELVAIYKLEFYRKQENWKFAHDKKPKKIKTPLSKYTNIRTLNETYTIAPETTDDSSMLNNGFLNDIPDKDRESPQETPAPANTLVEDAIHSMPWSAACQEYLEPERDNQQWWDGEQEVFSQPVWPDPVPPQDYGEVWAADELGYECVDSPPQWSYNVQMEELASAIERCGTGTDVSGQCVDRLEHPCAETDLSSDSFAEFIRGAHLAPHSSEIDLQIDTGGGWWSGSPALLSGDALAGEVRTHATALAALLRETALRNRAKLSRTCCSEQHLPLDPQWQDPRLLARQDTFTVSCTNVGTMGISGTPGRGRGRLHENHIIGIGMGRPYRLN